MTDRDLRELRRRADAAPDDGSARLDLARALARAGQRDDAVEECYRARLFGGDAAITRELLKSMNAPCSPWSHSDGGDAANTRCAPVRGPRKGEVVASVVSPFCVWPVVIAEDGRVLVFQDGGGVLFLDPRTLAVVEERNLPTGDGFFSADMAEFVSRPNGNTLAFYVGGEVFELGERAGFTCVRERGDEHPEIRIAPSGELFDSTTLVSARNRWVRIAAGADVVACLVNYEEDNASELEVLVLGCDRAHARGRFSPATAGKVRASPHSQEIAVGGDGRIYVVLHGETRGELVVLDSHGAVQLRYGAPQSVTLKVAPLRDGSCYVLEDEWLRRVDAEGNAIWEIARAPHQHALVTDRDSNVYTCSSSCLEAFDAEGHKLFEGQGRYRPVAIDALNRLLALRAVEGGEELVAIA